MSPNHPQETNSSSAPRSFLKYALLFSLAGIAECNLRFFGKINAVISTFREPTSTEDEDPLPDSTSCQAPALAIKAPQNKNILPPETARSILEAALKKENIENPKQWTQWILDAMEKEEFPYTASKMAAVLAITEQESGFQPDPKTTGILSKLEEQEEMIKKSIHGQTPF